LLDDLSQKNEDEMQEDNNNSNDSEPISKDELQDFDETDITAGALKPTSNNKTNAAAVSNEDANASDANKEERMPVARRFAVPVNTQYQAGDDVRHSRRSRRDGVLVTRFKEIIANRTRVPLLKPGDSTINEPDQPHPPQGDAASLTVAIIIGEDKVHTYTTVCAIVSEENSATDGSILVQHGGTRTDNAIPNSGAASV